jgi:glucokinase
MGVDVGGTTVATQLVDGDLQPIAAISVATDVSSPDRTLDSIAHGIEQTLTSAGITARDLAAIGFGIPGQVDAAAGMSRMAVNLHWYDYPVAARITARFGVPCLLDNDVRVATLGVYRFDNPNTCRNLVYVSIGTGVAAGAIVDGLLLRGRNGLAGEVGHWVVDPAGPLCNCGSRGCLETLVSATAVVRRARAALEAGATTQLCDQAPLTAKAVYDAAAAGDTLAAAIVDEVGAVLGVSLRNVLLAYDVDEIVLGGGPTRAGERYLAPIRAEWARQQATSPLARTVLRPEMVRIADPARNMGAWGAVALAAGAVAS